jgi:S-adenosylmethionine synthetase
VETFGTGRIPDERIVEIVDELFDLRPGAIIRDLGLRQPIFRQTANYGHFGREDLDLPWERLDRLEAVREAAGVDEMIAS